MNNHLPYSMFVFIGAIIGSCIVACAMHKDTVQEPKIEYVVKYDTIHDTISYPVVIYDSLCYRQNDSLKEELVISNYKLNRIAEYNKIAAKSKNIKYLRGWINRVLN